LINSYYLLKKLRYNSTAYPRTVRTRLTNFISDFIARHMRYPSCLKMQNMIASELRNALLLHFMSMSFHILYHIASKCLSVRDNNDM